jgi:hypothetical protein
LDYAGNSKKDKELKEVVDKHIEKVVSGDVVQKPKGLGRKFKDTFFGGDSKAVGRYIAADVLLPALRNLVVDMITKGAEKMIYGETTSRRPRDPRINYGAQYSLSSSRSAPFDPRNPLTAPPRGRLNRREISDVILSSRAEAELVVERLSDILEKYQVASLADLYDLLGLETSHIDNKWGWTFINNVPIRQIRQGYLLELPPLEEI